MAKNILLVLLFTIYTTSFARGQEQLQHDKKVFVDENDRVYVNMDLPMYFYFSTEQKKSSKKYQIKSEVKPKLTDPVEFRNEGHKSVTITYQEMPNGGRMPVNLDFHVDGSAPTSKSVYSSKMKYQATDIKLYSKDLKVDITSKDGRSMVAAVYFSLNGQPFQKYQNTLSFSKEAEYTLKYYAVDNVGNVEKVHNEKFVLDGSPPSSQYVVNGPSVDNTLAPEAKIELKGEDKTAGVNAIKFSLNGSSFDDYKEPISLKSLTDGKHSLQFYAIDNLGIKENKEAPENLFNFYLDLKAPDLEVSIEGTKYETEGFLFIPDDSKVVVKAKDNHIGVDKIFYKVVHEGRDGIDKTELTEYSSGISFSRNGKKTITFKGFDKLGNEREKSKILYVDKEKPKTGIKYGKPQIFTNDSLFITLTTNIELFTTQYDSGIKHTKFAINGGAEKIYDGSVAFDQEGTYRLQYYSVDNVGNKEMKKTALFNIDNTPPSVELAVLGTTPSYEQVDGEEAMVFSLDGVLKLDASDRCGVKQLHYWLNEGNKKDYSQTRQITINEARNYHLKVQAVDNLGNSTTQEFTFYVTE